MGTPKILIPKASVCMTELRRNPNVLKQLSDSQPTAISSRNKPIAYLLSSRAYETLLELIDDASLIQTVMARKGGNTIKVKI